MGGCWSDFRNEWDKERLDYDDFTKGKWISVFGSSSNRFLNNHSNYIIFKAAQAFFISAIMIYGILEFFLVKGCGPKIFIYLTYQTLTLQTVYTWVSLKAVMVADAAADDPSLRNSTMPNIVTATWILNDLLLPLTCFVFILYWLLVFPTGTSPLTLLNVLTHGVNFVVQATDVTLSRIPYYLFHGIYFCGAALLYVLWTVVYWSIGGTGCSGNPYIYAAIDWSEPESTLTILTAILFVASPILNLMFWFLITQFCPHREGFEAVE